MANTLRQTHNSPQRSYAAISTYILVVLELHEGCAFLKGSYNVKIVQNEHDTELNCTVHMKSGGLHSADIELRDMSCSI